MENSTNDVAHELVQITKLTRKISRRGRGERINRLILEEVWKHMRILRELIDVADMESSEILESIGTERLVLYNQWLMERYQQRLFTTGIFRMLTGGSDATSVANTTETTATASTTETTATASATDVASAATDTKPTWPLLKWFINVVGGVIAKFWTRAERFDD